MKKPVIIFLILVILYLLWSRQSSGIACSCAVPGFTYTPTNPTGNRCVGPLGVKMAEVCK